MNTCPGCGKSNEITSAWCLHCGASLRSPYEAPREFAGNNPPSDKPVGQLPTFSLPILLVLLVVTVGIYVPFWYRRAAGPLNRLAGKRYITNNNVLAALILNIAALVVGIAAGVFEAMEDPTLSQWVTALDGLTRAVNLGSVVANLVLAFAARRALHEILGIGPQQRSPQRLSGLATFFFGVLYIQLRVNELVDSPRFGKATEMVKPPTEG